MTLKFKIISHQNIQTFEDEVNNFLKNNEIVIIPESIKTKFVENKYIYSIHYYYKEEYDKTLQALKQMEQIDTSKPSVLKS